ncbi:ceramidase domain-containing protein [Shimia ponticola]|uniref:ceramidase domain-containing protein n=1 Tax=Shimia ponticola TaxID=2582893 RepID=UPI0011BEBF98|nr:ceramidase domain-containing protein [Shimia ponticola]
MFEQIDIYCERTDFTYWSEPLNAVTNAAFLIAALVMWHRTRGHGLPIATALIVILACIGVGSFLFHTHATGWASLADITPIGLFILLYLYAVGHDFLGWTWWQAGLLVVAFVPFAAVVTPLMDRLPFFQISNFYWNVPILLILFAPLVAQKNRQTALGMVIGASILTISITLRSYDMPVCDDLPAGSHFWWHILNGVMLGWMIEVYRRHMVGNAANPV